MGPRRKRYVRRFFCLAALLLCLGTVGWVLSRSPDPSGPSRAAREAAEALGVPNLLEDPRQFVRLVHSFRNLGGAVQKDLREPLLICLEEGLKSNDSNMRLAAVIGLKKLLYMRTDQITPLFCEALLDEDTMVREAAYSFFHPRINMAENVRETLFRAAQDDNLGKRARALTALAWSLPRTDPRFRELFEKAAQSSHARVQQTATGVLTAFEKKEAGLVSATLCTPPDDRVHTALLVASILHSQNLQGENVVSYLGEWLAGNASEETKLALVTVLGDRGPPAREALPAMLAFLKDGSNRHLQQTLTAISLVGIGRSEVIPSMISFLSYGDEYIARTAKEGLLTIDSSGSLIGPYLGKMLSSGPRLGQRMALDILEARPKAVPFVEQELADLVGRRSAAPLADIRKRAANLLKGSASESSLGLEALVDSAIHDESDTVRWECYLALREHPGKAKAVQEFSDVFRNEEAEVSARLAALNALWEVRISPQLAHDVLKEALTDSEKEIVDWAISRMGNLRKDAEDMLPRVMALLTHPDWQVRVNAIQAVEAIRFAGLDAIPDLTKLLRDENAEVRRAAAGALKRLGYGSAHAVPARKKAPQSETDAETEAILSRMGERMDKLASVLRRNEPGKSEDQEILRLIARLESPDGGASYRASSALSSYKSPRAAQLLLILLEGPHPWREKDLLWIIGNMGERGKAAVPALLERLENGPPTIRNEAFRSLKRIAMRGADVLPEIVEALGSAGPQAEEPLMRILVTTRYRSAETLPELLSQLEKEAKGSQRFQRAIQEIAEALGIGLSAIENDEIRERIALLNATLRRLRTLPCAEERTILALEKAIHQLRTELVYRAPLPSIPYAWLYVSEHPGLRASLIVPALWVGALAGCLAAFFRRPRALLVLDRRLAALDMRLAGRRFGVRHMLLLPALTRSTRALDAWVEGHIGSVRRVLEEQGVLHAHEIYIPAPVAVDGGKPSRLRPELVAGPFCVERPACLAIQGEGGIGKSNLACRIARWAMDDDLSCRLAPHRILPVFLDGSGEAFETEEAFIGEASRILQETAHPAGSISSGFFMRLLEKKRIVIIIDELAESNHHHVNALLSSEEERVREGVWIVTGQGEAPHGDVMCMRVAPQRLQPAEVEPFIAAYLGKRGFEAPPEDAWRREMDEREKPIPGDGLTVADAVARAERLLAAAASSGSHEVETEGDKQDG